MNSQNGNVAQALHERIDTIASSIKSAADQLSSASATAKDRASELTSRAVSGASSLGARAGRAIQAHPIVAIGIALGAGYLLMRLIRR